jgi:hypothetical protein
MIDEDKPSLDELTVLEHHGVKGMRWGVRKAAQSVATAHTRKRITVHKNALAGKGLVGAAAKLDKVTWGRNGKFQAYHNKKISELERSQERIANGELVAKTLLFGPQYSKK